MLAVFCQRERKGVTQWVTKVEKRVRTRLRNRKQLNKSNRLRRSGISNRSNRRALSERNRTAEVVKPATFDTLSANPQWVGALYYLKIRPERYILDLLRTTSLMYTYSILSPSKRIT